MSEPSPSSTIILTAIHSLDVLSLRQWHHLIELKLKPEKIWRLTRDEWLDLGFDQ